MRDSSIAAGSRRITISQCLFSLYSSPRTNDNLHRRLERLKTGYRESVTCPGKIKLRLSHIDTPAEGADFRLML